MSLKKTGLVAMFAHMIQAQHDPPNLSPVQSERIPTWRAAYSDRTSALMALFCEFAHLPIEPVQPAPAAGAPKIERKGGREKLSLHLETGDFRLVEVFNKDDAQGFLAIRDGHFAVLAFRGTETDQDRRTDFNFGPVPLPGVPGVQVHRGFLEVFQHCRGRLSALSMVTCHRRSAFTSRGIH
jgi:hypothetical protein